MNESGFEMTDPCIMRTLHLWFAKEVSLLQLVHILLPGTKDHSFRHHERSQDLPPLVVDKEKSRRSAQIEFACMQLTLR